MDFKQKILIVDDRPENLYLCEKILSEVDAEFIKATDGNTALKATLYNDFALAILDVQMPKMDGYELAEFIRNEDKTRDLPIIFLSAVYTDESHIFKGYESGAVDFLTKPFKPKLLLSKVKVFLSFDRQKKYLEELVGEMKKTNEQLNHEIAERKQAEEALREAHDELERRVDERTAELVIAIQQLGQEIEERKRAEEQIRSLSQQLLKTQESERQRLSRDLHDTVGGNLSALKIGCDTLFDDQTELPPGIRQRVSEFSKVLQESIMTVRDLSYDLRPSSLDQLGLVETVLHYCEDFSERNALKVDFFSVGLDNIKLDFDTEIALYRIIQEGLNNIQKHADASHVTIRLLACFPEIILRIEDNGKGFDVEKRSEEAFQEKRMGLQTMRERAALLNGKMKVESHLDKSTKILVELPHPGIELLGILDTMEPAP
ncbi:MAG: response regulator [Deltaproteobacteria bacterium]|nr:response regulator [Deltaproteobacteria bacterium]